MVLVSPLRTALERLNTALGPEAVTATVDESTRDLLPAVVLFSLEPDLKLMARQDVLGELDIKRAEVVQKRQVRAKNNQDLSFEVRPESGAQAHAVQTLRDHKRAVTAQ